MQYAAVAEAGLTCEWDMFNPGPVVCLVSSANPDVFAAEVHALGIT